MASLITRDNGTRELRFIAGPGKRPVVRLGRCDKRTGERALYHLERILAAQAQSAALPQDTAGYLRAMSDALYERFVRAGLLLPRNTVAESSTLPGLVNAFVARRTDLKPGTIEVFKQARKHLLIHFGETKTVASLTVGDAKDFRRYLFKRYSLAYTGKIIRQCRQVWKDAADRDDSINNVWITVPSGSSKNPARQFFVDRVTIDKIIDETPDKEWKLIIALARYGGLRTPSEHLRLTWDDIDWAKGRMTVRAKKTEHHQNKGIRIVPLFPEIRPLLQKAFDSAVEGERYVITKYRSNQANLRTQFEKLITRAGFTPWPRIFQNLRASRQTELADTFPIQVVCQWIGNTEEIAKAHYLQVREEHFARALNEGAPESAPRAVENGRNGSQTAAAEEAQTPENAKPPAEPGVSYGPEWIRTIDLVLIRDAL